MNSVNTSPLFEDHFFITPIYRENKKDWVEKLNIFSDPYIQSVREKNKSLNNNNDFGMVHHSESLIQDMYFGEFLNYINSIAFDILNNQGFDLTNYSLVTTDLWVQEFPSLGGGNHSPHTHWNGHVSGFYFLKCSDKTPSPIFHDPRSGRMMNLLPEKNQANITQASSHIFIKPQLGDFIFFNSSLQHEFPVDHGIDTFRFIHFNIQAFPKQILNYSK
jgi:uncharacterized protein (TIGR02466 family)